MFFLLPLCGNIAHFICIFVSTKDFATFAINYTIKLIVIMTLIRSGNIFLLHSESMLNEYVSSNILIVVDRAASVEFF